MLYIPLRRKVWEGRENTQQRSGIGRVKCGGARPHGAEAEDGETRCAEPLPLLRGRSDARSLSLLEPKATTIRHTAGLVADKLSEGNFFIF